MARTSSTLVAEIIEVDEDIPLTPFITAANALVNDIASPSGHTEERLTLIETYLAAHFYTLRDPRVVQENAGDVGATYQSRVDLGLRTSHYGQHAIILDTSGELLKLSSSRRTGVVYWAGVEEDRGAVAEDE